MAIHTLGTFDMTFFLDDHEIIAADNVAPDAYLTKISLQYLANFSDVQFLDAQVEQSHVQVQQ